LDEDAYSWYILWYFGIAYEDGEEDYEYHGLTEYCEDYIDMESKA